MEFAFTDEEETLRGEVQEFIRDNMTDELAAELEDHQNRKRLGPEGRKLIEKLRQRGWVAIAWPKELGGQGGSRIDQYIVEEELMRASLPVIRGGNGVVAIAAHGTEEQKATFVKPSLNDEVHFALGYSEPEAGADLAGLRMTYKREGDEFVLNGQKTFTSAAHYCTHIYLMARQPGTERYEGLSIFIVPIETPGITVTPLWTVQNDPVAPPRATYSHDRTNHVYFDDVRIPVSALLGKEGEGWGLSQSGLNLDRVGAYRYLMATHLTEDAVNLARNEDEFADRMRTRPAARDTLVRMWLEAQVCRLFTMRSMSIVEAGQKFKYEGAAEKVMGPEHAVHSTEEIAQLLGPYAQLLNGSPEAIEDGLYAHNLLGAYQAGINHGSVQIMRDQIARRGLGLPRNR